jgi:hypothetical protein
MESSSTSIAVKFLRKISLSWVQLRMLMREVKLLGTTTLDLPTWSILATLRSLAMEPSVAKEAMPLRRSSSLPLVRRYPSSVCLVTCTMRSKSLVLMPVGRIERMLVTARYSFAKALSCRILLVRFWYFSSSRLVSSREAW